MQAVQLDRKRKKSQKCALVAKKATNILGCIRRSVASWLKEVFLFSTALVKHMWTAVWGSPVKQRQGHAGTSPVKGHKNNEGTGHHDIMLQFLNHLHDSQDSLSPVCGTGMVLARVDCCRTSHDMSCLLFWHISLLHLTFFIERIMFSFFWVIVCYS